MDPNPGTVKSGAAFALTVVLAVASITLAALAHDLRSVFDGLLLAVAVAFGAVGFVIARRRPENAIGWLLLGAGILFALHGVATAYLVDDFRRHGGALPAVRLALALQPAWVGGMTCTGLAVLLFPDGRLPAPRWRLPLAVYVAVGSWFLIWFSTAEAALPLGNGFQINAAGNYSGSAHGFPGTAAALAWVSAPAFLCFLGAFVIHQARSWRTASGERREQLKWLLSGGAISVVAIVVVVFANDTPSLRVVTDSAATGLAALPLGIGVGILKYRLYEIDQLISRTISYLLLTGLLAVVFVGVVALATDVLPFSSPVGVAASTLAAAAIFNPLRVRLQRIVDRRFNRARYDAEATVEAFARRLREAVDLDSVQAGLLESVAVAVEPVHLSVWMRQTR